MSGGLPSPGAAGALLSCRACSLPLYTLLATFVVIIIIAPPLIPLPVVWAAISAYPAYIARSRFRRVPRLLLIAYASALLTNALACALCIPAWLEESPPIAELSYLDPVASVILAAACLWKAWRGGGQNLLAFLTFYSLIGTVRVLL